MKNVRGLHVILGGIERARIIELARVAEEEGVAVVQLREKTPPTGEILKTADALRGVLRSTTFIINDRADIALAVGADGVHLGQDDLPIREARTLLGESAVIGATTPSVDEAIGAERAGANYVGFGHLFPTHSKIKATPPKSLSELRHAISAVTFPVIAIGGISVSNLDQVIISGLGGVAVIGAITNAADPQLVMRHFVRMLETQYVTLE